MNDLSNGLSESFFTFEMYLPSVGDTEQLAARIARYMVAPMTITLSGAVGSGKTTLMRAILQQLGVQERIKSPTYSLVESYDLGTKQIHHFDFYRIEDPFAIEDLGFREYFQPDSICCIEWPERMDGSNIRVDLAFYMTCLAVGRQLRLVSKQIDMRESL